MPDGREQRIRSTLERALESVNGAAAILDAEGGIVRANRAAQDELGDASALRRALVAAAQRRRVRKGRWTLRRLPAAGAPEYLVVAHDGPTCASVDVRPAAARWGLTPRQRDVLAMVVQGHTNQTIGAALSISQRTVEVHVTALLARAGVESRMALAASVFRAR